MKKILTILLSVCLLASLVTCFAIATAAEEEIVPTVGQQFAWNDQAKDVTGDAATEAAWRKGNAKSPDGLWKYQFYSLQKEIYQPMVYATGGIYAWNKNPGPDDNGIGYARVRHFGRNFHPADKADVVKTFICPSGGTIQISTTVARANNLEAGKGTGTSIAIYKMSGNERTLIYPEAGGGEYLALVSTTPTTFDVTVDVKKGEHINIHIGAMENQGSDAVDMSNIVTYKSINDDVMEEEITDTTISGPTSYGTNYVVPTLSDNNASGNAGGAASEKDGLPVGAIVGIAIGAVAVVGIAVAVVVIVKKKKQD